MEPPTLDPIALTAARRRQRRNHEALEKTKQFEQTIAKLKNENDNLAAQLQALRKDLQNANLQLANARARLKKKDSPEPPETETEQTEQTETEKEPATNQETEKTETETTETK